LVFDLLARMKGEDMSGRKIPSGKWSLPLLCALVSLLLTAPLSTPAFADLWAGAAKVTITPPECSVGGACPGYSLAAGNGRFSSGVHDHIWARALVMTSGVDSLILVTLDVLGHFPDRIRGMQTELRAAYPGFVEVLVNDDGVTDPVTRTYADGTEIIRNVLIANAHTHASPDCIGIYGPDSFTSGVDPAWMDFVDDRVVEVVGLAISSLVPAKVRFGQYYVPNYLGFPLHTDNREPIILDHNMEVMQVANLSDAAICTLVNHGGYPEMMGIVENTEITADFAGVMYQDLEAEYGGVAMWITRVVGGRTDSYYDVNFNGIRDDDAYPPNNYLNTFEGMTAYGNTMADVAIEALSGALYEDPVPDIVLKTTVVGLAVENPFFKVLLGEANYAIAGLLGDMWAFLADLFGMTSLIEPGPELMLDREGQGALGAPRKVEMPVTVFKLGGAMFTTTPGQIFPELWTGTSPLDLLANPAWDFHPSEGGNPDFDYHPRIPGLTGIRDFITTDHAFNLGSTYAELGYLIPGYQYDHSIKTYDDFLGYVVGTHQVSYEESDCAGRESGNMVQRELIRIISEFNAGLVP
jgi:hypothetical protein